MLKSDDYGVMLKDDDHRTISTQFSTINTFKK